MFALILPLLASAQNETISSVTSKLSQNILYRGIENPIKIAATKAKFITAEAPGIRKIDSLGNYVINVTSIIDSEVMVKIRLSMFDGSIVLEEKKFTVKDIGKPRSVINGQNCFGCLVQISRKDLNDSKIGIKYDEYFVDESKLDVKSFAIKIPNKNSFVVVGNKFDDRAIREILNLKIGSIFEVDVLSTIYRIRTYPIKIVIID